MGSTARKSQSLAKRAKSAPSARSRASAARATALAPSSEATPARAATRASGAGKARTTERCSAPKLPIRSSPFAAEDALRPTLETIQAAPVTKPVAKSGRAAQPRGFVRKPVMQELEGRLLLSADLNPAAQDTLFATPALQGAEFRALVEPGNLPAIASMQVAPILRTNELVFVDTATPEYEALVADMRDTAAAQGRHLEFVLIDAERDGIRKITDTLAQKSDLDAIHIVSHATDGAVQLGSSRLDFESLTKRSAAIKTWGNALTEDGDILIYGCDLASSEQGKALVEALARLTGADVAASEDLTGSAELGGDWKLEFATGRVEAAMAVSAAGAAQWRNVLVTTDLDGSTPWTTVLQGSNFDFGNDTQAASGADLVGGPNHGALYTNFDDLGTPGTADDQLAFRVRVGGDNSTTLSGVIFIGIDANGDGALDAFVGVDNQGSGNYVRIWDTGTDSNTSPNTTSVSPTGYSYAQTAANYDYSAVGATNDPDWDGSTDLNANGKIDRLLSFQLPFADLAAFLGTQGIGGVTKDTPLRYIFATSTQNNAINSDIGGVNGGVSSGTTWDALGAFSPPLSAANIFPSITSNGGGATASVSVSSGTQAVTTVVAGDANGDTVTYSISGGLDQSKFTINSVTGALIFTTAPNYYAPTDSNADNVYQVQVTASDGRGGTDVQTLDVTVAVGAVDNTAPALVLTGPLDNATGVPTNSNIVLVFDEPVKLGASGTFLIFQSSPPAGTFETFTVSSPRITVSGNTVIIDPTADFSNNKSYYVQVSSGAITDLAGNAWAGISNTTGFNFTTGNATDATAPAAPTLDLLAASDTGVSSSDDVTSDDTPTIRVALNGAGTTAPVAGDTVKLFLGAVQIATVVLGPADITNDYVDVTLSGLGADGAKSLTATITDTANNASAASAALVVTLDTTATLTVSEPISGGFVNTAESTSVSIGGTSAGVEAGRTVTVTVSDTSGPTPDVTGTAAIGAGGGWTVTGLDLSTLVDGNLTVTATASDLAGNAANDTATVVLDRTPPAVPVLTGISDDAGASATDELTNDQTLFFNGTADANTLVEVFVDAVSVGIAPVNGSGNWSFDYTGTTLAAGSYSVTARGIDATGNASALSAALPVVIETTAPTTAILGAPASHDGATPFTVTLDFSEAVTGFAIGDIAVAGATLGSFVAVDGNTYTVQVTPSGAATITLDVSGGAAQDAAGNANTAATQVTVAPPGNNAPTDIALSSATIAENVAPGATVGTLSSTDPDAGNTFTYTLVAGAGDGDNAAFTITGTTLSINASPDFETKSSYSIRVRTTDQGGLAFEEQLTISITNVNEAPTATNLAAPETYTEDTPLDLTDIVVSDVDSANVTVTLTLSDLAAGALSIATSGSVTSTFAGGVWTASGALADVNALLAGASFTPAANYNSAFTIATGVSDGTAAIGGIKTMTGTPVNDAPTPLNNSFVITSGGTTLVSSANLSATDVDTVAGTLTFAVSGVVNGRFELVGAPGVAIGAFTQALILGGQVQFVHTGGGAPSFDLTVSDGTALTGPYPGNIVFIGGTPPPAPGGDGSGEVGAAIAGLFDTAAPPPGAIGGELAFASVQAAPLVLPAPLIGLSDRFGVAFTRTPTIATSAISESGPTAGFAEAAPAAQALQGPIDAKIGADRGLPPIKVAGDVIETRIAAPEIAVARLRADELGVNSALYAYACVPENVDPPAAALRAVPSEQRLEPDADDRWRLDVTSGALTITGLAVAAGGLWWAARASGLVSGLLAAAPTWRHLDPLPALGRDKKDKKKRRAKGDK